MVNKWKSKHIANLCMICGAAAIEQVQIHLMKLIENKNHKRKNRNGNRC